MFALKTHRLVRATVWTVVAVVTWLAASVPSGFSVAQIAMFIAPGMVLSIAMNWTSYAAFPERWRWPHGLRAAAIGAGIFPPFVALFCAWAGTFGSGVMLTLLVFSAWVAVLGGLMIALGRLALTPRSRSPG